ncbi:MAG: YebC/PmpR family DNA-binding transcriptional regulator [Patescibacteria group bacterium]
MAGHSKWHNIQARKGVQDKRRATLFTKLSRDIATAAKEGGVDAATNARLKTMLEKAREAGMPKDNVTRAINRGAGIGEAANLTAITYEGKGPGGIDVIVEARTNNKNRTASDVKHIFTKNGGVMGGPGSSAWNFEHRGMIECLVLDSTKTDEQILKIMDASGVVDIVESDGEFLVYTTPSDLMAVRSHLAGMGYDVTEARFTQEPKSTTTLEGEVLDTAVSMLEELDEYDDVDAVYTNLI